MKEIGVNDNLLDNFTLISGQITKICIYEREYILCIDISIRLMYKKNFNEVLLRFTEVYEYGLNYSSDHIFYNIEDYKFLKGDDFYYISFDPFDLTKNIISDDDNDFIKAKKVEAYINDQIL